MTLISFEDCPPKDGPCIPLGEGPTSEHSIIRLSRSVSHRGPQSWSAFHRKRDPTARTLEIAYPHPAILQHVNPYLFKTVWTDIMLGETCKRIDCRTAFQLRQLVLAS